MRYLYYVIFLLLSTCSISCIQKAESEQQQPQPEAKPSRTDFDGKLMTIENDTLEVWLGAEGENRITGLVCGEKSGLSIIYGFPGRISVWKICLYAKGKRVAGIAVDHARPVDEESERTKISYDKFGYPIIEDNE